MPPVQLAFFIFSIYHAVKQIQQTRQDEQDAEDGTQGTASEQDTQLRQQAVCGNKAEQEANDDQCDAGGENGHCDCRNRFYDRGLFIILAAAFLIAVGQQNCIVDGGTELMMRYAM